MENLNLFQKISAISNEIAGIDKDMTVGVGNGSYKAVSDKNVMLKVKAAEHKHGIISIPVSQELIKSEILESAPDQYGKVKITYVDIVKMVVKIIDVDEPTSFIEIESFGRGIDSGDKGFGKASTYARKYAILNAYKIATGVDPDQEPSEEMEIVKKAKVLEAKPKKDVSKLSTPEQWQKLVMWVVDKNKSIDDAKAAYNIADIALFLEDIEIYKNSKLSNKNG